MMLYTTLALAFLLGTKSTSAITDGELDGDGNPEVGLLVAYGPNPDTKFDGLEEPLRRCTGSLISPTIFVTAGHCVEPPTSRVDIWFDTDVEAGIPDNGYSINDPDNEGNTWSGEVTSRNIYIHPDYDPAAFTTHDLAVVVLDEPYELPPGKQYGKLPSQDLLSVLAANYPNEQVQFEAVGYGLQRVHPLFLEADPKRYVSYPKLIQVDNVIAGDFSIITTNNPKTGGTCFGDSGGPYYLTGPEEVIDPNDNILAGITSYVKNYNCAGIGGVYRIDKKDDLEWLKSFGVDAPEEGGDCDGLKKNACKNTPGCVFDEDDRICINDDSTEAVALKNKVDGTDPVNKMNNNSGSAVASKIFIWALCFVMWYQCDFRA